MNAVGPVGLVGLGVMGAAMARRLAGEGVEVVATSRSAASRNALGGTPGVTVVETAADVARMLAGRNTLAGRREPAESAHDLVVLVSVTAGPQVREVVLGEEGLLAGLPLAASDRRLVVVDTSTCAPQDARDLAAELATRGHALLDAPVSGGPTGVRDGTLSIMLGGDAAQLDAVQPLLDALAGRVTHCGAAGSGQVVKAANQLVVACTLEAVAEALALGARHGVAPATVRDALLGGYAASRVLDLAGRRMVEGDFSPGGSAALLAKDVAIIEELAAAVDVAVPALQAVAGQVARLAAGSPEADHSALITLLGAGSGTVA